MLNHLVVVVILSQFNMYKQENFLKNLNFPLFNITQKNNSYKLTGSDSDNLAVDVHALSEKCYSAMNDDFNTPILIASLFEGVKVINSAADGRIELGSNQILQLKDLYNGFLKDVLGLIDEGAGGDAEESEDFASNLLDLLIEMRSNAKANKDWDSADKIRNTLSDLGITIKDSKEGSTWSHE